MGKNKDGINSDTEAGRHLYAIGKIEEEIERLKEERERAIRFWESKIDSAKERIQFLEGAIEAYIQAKGENGISTPDGSAHFRTRQKFKWPSDDEVLKKFSRDRDIDLNRRVIEKPSKRNIKQYAEETGDLPPQTEIVEVKDFIVSPDID